MDTAQIWHCLNYLQSCSHSSPCEAESATVPVVKALIQRLCHVKINEIINEGTRWWNLDWYTERTCGNV